MKWLLSNINQEGSIMFNFIRKQQQRLNARTIQAVAYLASVIAVLQPTQAGAQQFGRGQSFGQIANNFVQSIQGAGAAVTAVCWIAALAMGAVAVFKFKANADNPQQTPLKIPLIYMAVAAGLAAVPEVIGTGVVSIWGGGAQQVSPAGNF